MALLFQTHNAALITEFGNVENYARMVTHVLPGTPGSVLERTNAAGFRYYTHQYYDGDGKKREIYLAGPVGTEAVEQAAEALRERIAEAKQIISVIRLLGREGFSVADAKTFATLASLHNHGVFRAGGVLIGSHAYGVLLNSLGIRAVAYKTEDVDIARCERLAFEKLPAVNFLQMLRDSGIDFVEVPQLDVRKPSTSFKQRGRATFHVDLLVPSDDDSYPIVAVPELKAHATGLPYLRYLLGETHDRPLLAREGCCQVRVPSPERFAVHKLLVSQLRNDRGGKTLKDLQQGTTLLAALGEFFPGAIEEALAATPISARKHLRTAIDVVMPQLVGPYPRAAAELGRI